MFESIGCKELFDFSAENWVGVKQLQTDRYSKQRENPRVGSGQGLVLLEDQCPCCIYLKPPRRGGQAETILGTFFPDVALHYRSLPRVCYIRVF